MQKSRQKNTVVLLDDSELDNVVWEDYFDDVYVCRVIARSGRLLEFVVEDDADVVIVRHSFDTDINYLENDPTIEDILGWESMGVNLIDKYERDYDVNIES